MHVLGFDYGHKNIGIAIGQTISRTASPLITLHRKDGPPWDSIEALIQEWHPGALVIGLPLDADGSEQPITIAARQFSKTIENKYKKKYNFEMYFHDERYSSQAAESLFSKKNNQRKNRKSKRNWDRDAVAAVLILEAWLEIGHS